MIKITPSSIIIAVALVLCAWWLFGRGCSKPLPAKNNVARVIKAADPYWIHKYDSINTVMQQEHSTADSLRRVVITNGSHIKGAATFITKLIERKLATASKYCDSLANLTTDLIAQVATQDTVTASLIESYEQQLTTKDSAIAAHVEQYAQLRQGFDSLSTSYDALNLAIAKSNRQAKVQRTVGRVLAGAVVVLGGLLLLHK